MWGRRKGPLVAGSSGPVTSLEPAGTSAGRPHKREEPIERASGIHQAQALCHLWRNRVKTTDRKVSPTGFHMAQRLGKLKELGGENTVGDVLGPWSESRSKGHPRGRRNRAEEGRRRLEGPSVRLTLC